MSRTALASTRLLMAVLLLAGGAATPSHAAGKVMNGFDLSGASIPFSEIMGGGPPRDGIPALVDPVRDAVEVADRWIEPQDRVIGVSLGGDAVAYPLAILSWHELVNDVVGGRPVLVTYCPLCGTGIVFDALLDGERRLFGVSGLLFRSDVLLYERGTDSLCSQLLMECVSGPRRGTKLRPVAFRVTTWEAWREEHPDTRALSLSTGFAKDYFTDPYGFYHRSRATMFPVRFQSGGRKTKSWAYLVDAPEHPVIVPEPVAARWPGGAHRLEDGRLLRYHAGERRLAAEGRGGRELTVVPGYWFAHRAFYPNAPVVE